MRTVVEAHKLLPKGLYLESLSIEAGRVSISVSSVTERCVCPLCGRGSSRVHSRYSRTVSDLPWHGISVTLKVRAKRLFCDVGACERKIFCERLAEIPICARKTDRLQEALLAIALELGGRAGARLAGELGLSVGRDALLSRVKRSIPANAGKVRVLGVDDFAFRKGHSYGTILVDLEGRKVVDLLPECSQQSLMSWLRQHPGVELATRDRSKVYREALTKSAPNAVQVADRWHLLHGLAGELEGFLIQKRKVLRDAVLQPQKTEGEEDVGAPGPTTPNRPRLWRARQEESARLRHERLIEQWKDIRRLHLAGANVRFISSKLGVSPRTVYNYRDMEEPPPRRDYTTRASVLDPYVPYLLKRWEEGCRNGEQLLGEIRERGYTNSKRTFLYFTGELRRAEAKGKPPSAVPRAKKGAVAGLSPSAKNVAALFMRREEKLSKEHKEYLDKLCNSDGSLADARRLTQEFTQMARDREGEKLDVWLEEAEASQAEVMRRFAAGLNRDLLAVRAGLTRTWNNGPVEGYVHKLKLIKRQGYGRADFDLLRARVLAA